MILLFYNSEIFSPCSLFFSFWICEKSHTYSEKAGRWLKGLWSISGILNISPHSDLCHQLQLLLELQGQVVNQSFPRAQEKTKGKGSPFFRVSFWVYKNIKMGTGSVVFRFKTRMLSLFSRRPLKINY